MGFLDKLGFGTPKTPDSSALSKPGYNEELKLGKFTPTEAEVEKARREGGEPAVEALRNKFAEASRRKAASATENAINETQDAISRDIEGGSVATH